MGPGCLLTPTSHLMHPPIKRNSRGRSKKSQSPGGLDKGPHRSVFCTNAAGSPLSRGRREFSQEAINIALSFMADTEFTAAICAPASSQLGGVGVRAP